MKFVYNKYFYGEKTSKHFDQCGSCDEKTNKKKTLLLALVNFRTQ